MAGPLHPHPHPYQARLTPASWPRDQGTLSGLPRTQVSQLWFHSSRVPTKMGALLGVRPGDWTSLGQGVPLLPHGRGLCPSSVSQGLGNTAGQVACSTRGWGAACGLTSWATGQAQVYICSRVLPGVVLLRPCSGQSHGTWWRPDVGPHPGRRQVLSHSLRKPRFCSRYLDQAAWHTTLRPPSFRLGTVQQLQAWMWLPRVSPDAQARTSQARAQESPGLVSRKAC